jgi:endonuclease/exonuclease/phosphatase family metal-dependent hydrolase
VSLESGALVTVATLNVHGRGPRWRSRRVELVRQLVELDVDAIALQELRTWPSQGRWLVAASPTGYAFAGARKHGIRGYEGIGIVTRLPMREREIVRLGPGGRVALRCRLEAGGGTFDLYSVHFQHGGSAGEVRLRAAERLLEVVDRRDGPVVVAGDLNGPPESRAVKLLTESLRSAHMVAKGREPASTVVPVERGVVLDYILVSEGIEVVEARVAFDEVGASGETVSDHLGLVARLQLPADG